jgi:drug/metabolite transporter (DMT)-like permease
MEYYAIITASVILFALTFFFNDRYQKESGSDMGATFVFSLINSLAGLLCLLALNRFRFEFTPFTLLMATLTAINAIAYIFCSLKAFAHINISLYSIFAMLGGMLLPFVVGIVFYDETLTVGKGVSLVLIIAALAFTVKRDQKKNGGIYYAGVFILNGMSGVLAKIFQSAPYEAASAASYSIWSALVTVVISVGVLIVLGKRVKKPSGKAVALSSCFGILSKIGNYMLLIALAVLPASVQYPFVTGGTMIVSTVIALICRQKPSYREYISVGLSFAGVMILVFWS